MGRGFTLSPTPLPVKLLTYVAKKHVKYVFFHTISKNTKAGGVILGTLGRGPIHMYKKLVFCTIVRPYIVYVILPWLRPPESEKAGNLLGFGHTLYGGEPHTLHAGSAIHCMSQAPYIVRARPRTLYEPGPNWKPETSKLQAGSAA